MNWVFAYLDILTMMCIYKTKAVTEVKSSTSTSVTMPFSLFIGMSHIRPIQVKCYGYEHFTLVLFSMYGDLQHGNGEANHFKHILHELTSIGKDYVISERFDLPTGSYPKGLYSNCTNWIVSKLYNQVLTYCFSVYIHIVCNKQTLFS